MVSFFFFIMICFPTRMDLLHNLRFCIISLLVLKGTFVTPFHPPDNIAINCGFSGNQTAPDGREWIGDSGSIYFVSREPNSKSISSSSSSSSHFHGIPFSYARISQTQFTYVFPVSPGPKFVRLHFYPASYRAFAGSNAFFTVKAAHFTLLDNFSASLTADSLGITTVPKEFCINVESSDLPLNITFSPSSRTGPSDEVYAFVNAIEVVSMPEGLYYPTNMKKNEWEVGSKTALETVHRLNIGGSYVPSAEDTGMFREWSEDTRSFIIRPDLGTSPLATTMPIKYGKAVPNHVAPQKVYQTTWTVDPNENDDAIVVQEATINFTWKLPVDQGFRYLIRLHFCELDYAIQEYGARAPFSIYADNQTIEAHGDVFKWSGELGTATYKDYIYVVHGDKMDGKRNILLSLLRPIASNMSLEATDVVLKGLEMFKLSNPDNSLAAANHPLVVHSNKIGTIVVCLVTAMLAGVVASYLHSFKRAYPPKYEGSCRVFSLAEVRSATKNFNDELVIGRGASGVVYRGSIDSGTTMVAMKLIQSNSRQGEDEFRQEIEMISKLRHENVVTLIGYCKERSKLILVYEYMAQGTLADHLFYRRKPLLSWEQRVQICIDAARGLAFLHKGGIIHRDVKSTNILLDENMRAKIADFGLSKMVPASYSVTHVSTAVRGTCGYLDPDYYSTSRLTKKSDVYAFGVVLWEALCGRPAIDETLEGKDRSLARWAPYCFSAGMIDQIIEPGLKEQMSALCLKTFIKLANSCLNSKSNERPSMKDVVKELEVMEQISVVKELEVMEQISVVKELEVRKRSLRGNLEEIATLHVVFTAWRFFRKLRRANKFKK